jgi:hypothetical protein
VSNDEWRVARSLLTLRDQINAAFPHRSKASDGTIGDEDHQNRTSDHNPWFGYEGEHLVTALDITHDPGNGVDIDRLTDELAASRDPRIKYIIANDLILDSRPGNSPWQWVEYDGSNEHSRHFHLSVMPNHTADDTRPWNLPSLHGSGGTTPEDTMTPAQEKRVLDAIAAVPGRTWNHMIYNHLLKRKEWAKTALGAVQDRVVRQQIAPLRGQVEALAEAYRQDRTGEPRDLAAIEAAAERGTRTALAEGTVQVDIEVAGKV